ncbi:MerR family transcriptional regulator [Microlunatus sagamiharensis]|uniref:MerR family transcriptional regulator n=1 Tax=Microlunatus sagamiharensis TaxID=546874 RepID=UPI000B80D1A2|nr:MerR family transcriptional regulator [Microlunatus sagamiharensis]
MRSSELARLAGVSIRTLRHYHQIGLLPEPRRSANGYRDYTASDLVRVLRTRRLVGLGVSLSHIDPALDAGRELELLELRYTSEIEELTTRLEAIRALRHRGARPDTPTFAHGYLEALSARKDVPPRSVGVERDAALVLELLLDEDARVELERLNPSDLAELVDVSAALLGIAANAGDDQIDALARALAAAVGRLCPRLVKHELTLKTADALEHHVSAQLTEAQLDVVRRALRLLP